MTRAVCDQTRGIMRILVTGNEGQVVRSLAERTAADPGISMTALGRPGLDLARPETIADALTEIEFDLVVNAAAYTAVDRAETEPDLARKVNCDGAEALARVAAQRGVPIIHISTDYVFNGLKPGPWREDDIPDPLSVYGKSKLAGELAVLAANTKAVVLRTAWVYSPFGNNFLKTMLRLAETRQQISVVSDQTGAPTSALDIADGIISVARNLLASPDDANLYGVFHMTAGADEAGPTWADFAENIFAASTILHGPAAEVLRIPTAQYPTPAARPQNSLLDCSKLLARHNVQLPPWRASVENCVRRVLAARD